MFNLFQGVEDRRKKNFRRGEEDYQWGGGFWGNFHSGYGLFKMFLNKLQYLLFYFQLIRECILPYVTKN